MEFFLVVFISFATGYVIALVQKGVHIHHHQEKQEDVLGYNESTAYLMNEDMKAYFDKNNGMRDY